MKILNQSLQSHISQSLSKLRPSTTIIISSSPTIQADKVPRKTDQSLKAFSNHLKEQVEKSYFYPLQFNLKTVSYGSHLIAKYPVENDLQLALEMMKRTGSTNVIGVGSGPAIDLAKACHAESDQGELILCPSTLGGLLASTSKQSILLSQEEETLMPHKIGNQDNVTVVMDQKGIAIPSWVSREHDSRRNDATALDAALAGLVISLDAAISLENDDHFDKYSTIIAQNIEASSKCIDAFAHKYEVSEEVKLNAIHAMLQSGSLLSYGDGNIRRSVPHALTSALLPRYFPHGNWITFTASILPGLVSAIHDDSEYDNNIGFNMAIQRMLRDENASSSQLMEWVNNMSKFVPKLASFAEDAPDVDILLSKLDDNGVFLKCKDADSDFLERILISSLNR
jgi:hypothetical protein